MSDAVGDCVITVLVLFEDKQLFSRVTFVSVTLKSVIIGETLKSLSFVIYSVKRTKTNNIFWGEIDYSMISIKKNYSNKNYSNNNRTNNNNNNSTRLAVNL